MYRKDHCRRNLCSWKKKTEEKNSTLCHFLKANNKVTLYDLSDGYNIKHICKLFIITILLAQREMLFDVDHIAIYTWKSKRYILINKHFMAVLKTKKQ